MTDIYEKRILRRRDHSEIICKSFQICHPTYIFIPVSLAEEAVSPYKSRADFSLPEKISPDFSGKCGIGYITSYINYIINLKQVSGTHKNINLLGSACCSESIFTPQTVICSDTICLDLSSSGKIPDIFLH